MAVAALEVGLLDQGDLGRFRVSTDRGVQAMIPLTHQNRHEPSDSSGHLGVLVEQPSSAIAAKSDIVTAAGLWRCDR